MLVLLKSRVSNTNDTGTEARSGRPVSGSSSGQCELSWGGPGRRYHHGQSPSEDLPSGTIRSVPIPTWSQRDQGGLSPNAESGAAIGRGYTAHRESRAQSL